ncbi:MAG: cell division protein FtsB [Candidatus Azotimanducaceae bacterium]|jgi:cell division protein FtsB
MTPGRGLIVGLVLIVLFLQGRLWLGEGSLAEVSGLQVRVERESAENSIKEQRNRVLRAEIVELKSGLESIEEKARSEFGLIKEGETFFLLVDESKSRQP